CRRKEEEESKSIRPISDAFTSDLGSYYAGKSFDGFSFLTLANCNSTPQPRHFPKTNTDPSRPRI
ncbi:hypothetical protein ACLOJK_002878, partial [Asimina triloba]